MKKYILPMLALLVCSRIASAQTAADSATIANTAWETTLLRDGLVCRQAEIPFLYNAPQHVSILEVDAGKYKFGIAVGSPKSETSVSARSAGAVAAVNGSYFDVKKGNSVCYLREGKTVVDTTTAGEFDLRVTGAIEIRKGKIKVIPWSKDSELSYRKKKNTVLASGPLLLGKGEVCDFSECGESFIRNKHPRSAVAVTGQGKVLLITVDGRFPDKAEGVNIPELAHLVRILGGIEAINLDGGGSTTLWAADAPESGVLNRPCDNKAFDSEGERKVANAICVYQ